MDFVNLGEKQSEARENKKRKIDLFGTDNFRSWMLYFVPGDGTDMHYHASPETFLVLKDRGRSKALKATSDQSKNTTCCFLAQRIITRLRILEPSL